MSKIILKINNQGKQLQNKSDTSYFTDKTELQISKTNHKLKGAKYHLKMSHVNRNFNKNPSNRNQIPHLKPSALTKYSNEQRLKQVYQSTSVKQKQKQRQKSQQKNGRRYYLQMPNIKNIQNGQKQQPGSSARYKSYLQGEQIQKKSPLTYRYPQKSNRYDEIQNRSDLSTNLQLNANIRRKAPDQILSQIDCSKRKDSTRNFQNEANQLNESFARNKNSLKHHNVQSTNANPKHRVSSNYEQNAYQNQILKVRRSTKKSLSRSFSKKPSQDGIRQEGKLQSNLGTKSQLPSPNSDPLQQGKAYFKAGVYKQALQCFQRGQQSQPKNLNFSYNSALVHLKQHNYEEGLGILQQIITADPQFKRTVYLFASISSKHLNRLEEAVHHADNGLHIYRNFVDLIFYRGKLHREMNNKGPAVEDLKKVISSQKGHIQANYVLASLYYDQHLLTHAMSSLSSAIHYDQDKNSEFRHQALKLRAKLYLAQGNTKQAKRDIMKLKAQKQSSHNAQIYYLLGKLQIQQNNVSDALINFEKCLRQSTRALSVRQASSHSIFTQTSPNQHLIPSLIQICKTKIDIKDFYSAYHHISRAKHYSGQINQHDQSLLRFRYFIEGVIFLMKRKVDDAMKNFQRFRETEGKTSHSTNDHCDKNWKGNKQLNSASLTQKQLHKQIRYFYPTFYLYRAYGYFMQNNHQLAIKDYEEFQKYVPLDKYTLYNLLLARGIAMMNKRDFQAAVKYFNNSEQLFLKSQNKKIQPCIYRAMSSIQEARLYHYNLVDHKKINANKINEDSIQNLSSCHPSQEDSDIKVLQLVFQALKQLDKAYDINESNSNLLFIRCLIYAYLNKLDQSLDDIVKAISKSEQNVPKYFFFRGLLQSTLQNKKLAINDFNISINLDNNYAAVFLQRAKLYFQTQNYSKALEDLQKFSLLKPQQDIQFHKTALYLVNGLYPMAEETSQLVKDQQTQKYKQIKFHILLRLVKLQEAQHFTLPQFQTDTILLRIIAGDITDVVEVKNAQKIFRTPQYSKIKFFNIIQYYHILGLVFFSVGQYQKALDQFTIALKQCHLRDMQKSASQYTNLKKPQQNDDQNNNLGQKDVNCIMYNIFLCHLKLGEIKRAYEVFVKQILSVNQIMQKSEFMVNFSHLLFKAMKKSISWVGLEARDRITAISIQDKEEAHVQLFNNMFTDLFSQQISIQTPTFFLKTKLCYLNMECEKLRLQYSAKLCPQQVLSWLSVKQIENRPEPPWMKRQSSDEGLIFTDQVQNINIEFQTTQHDEQSQEEQEDGEEQINEQSYHQNTDQNEHQEHEGDSTLNLDLRRKFDPSRFRDQMKLDASIQRKLNKIVNKRKPDNQM